MSFLQLISQETKEKLHCGYCSNLLSVPGVTVPDDDGALYACGRCSKSNGSFVRASAYEAVASMIRFPCRYSEFGCNKQPSWGSVMDHENACNHRVYECIAKDCNWQSTIKTLKLHISEMHKSIILKKGILVISTENCKSVYVMYVHDEIFLVQCHISDLILSMSVKYLGKASESGRFRYAVDIRDRNSKQLNSVMLYDGKMKTFTDYGNVAEQMDIEFDINSLNNIFKSINKIKCFIKISQNIPKKEKKVKEIHSKNETNNEKSKSNKPNDSNRKDNQSSVSAQSETNLEETSSNQETQKNIIRELECPVCQEYMSPPIFICTLGHSICGDCKVKLSKCPTCCSDYGNTRNYTLENMLHLVNLPCQNEVYGCNFIGNLKLLQQHKGNCKNVHIKCPVPDDCKWQGAIDLLAMHLKSHHKRDIFIKLDEIITRDLNAIMDDHKLVQFQNNIYRISCKHGKKINGLIQWSFQNIISKTSKNYKIEIEFLDQTDNNRKFIINDTFHERTDDKEIFNEVLGIPLALIQPYVNSSNLLHFKYHLY